MASRVFTMATAVVLCVPVLFAGYQVQANAVSSFGISFHRVAILPANAPEGVAPLWLEQLVFEKLAGRKIATVASAQVRQALFELGVTAVSREMLPQLAAKLRVDAFVDASVGSAGRKNYGAIATPIYGGSVIASPIETNRGAVEITFISANSAKMLMHGVASGESGWRSQKGVIGTMFDQMFDKVFTPQFYVEYTPEFVNEWMKSQPVK